MKKYKDSSYELLELAHNILNIMLQMVDYEI